MSVFNPAPTSLWRLEWLRLVRAHRWLGLGGLFVLLGLSAPILAANLGWLVNHAGTNGQFTIEVPRPTPADGIGGYARQVAQIGMIVLIVSAAGPLCPYGRRQLGIFYRMMARAASGGVGPGAFGVVGPGASLLPRASAAVLLPRFTVSAVSAVVVYLLGTACAWYETAVLIAAPDPGAVLAGAGCCALYLVFCLAVVGVVGSVANGTLVTASLSVLVVMVIGIAESLPTVGRFMPTRLVAAPADLLGHGHVVDYLPAVGVCVACVVAMLLAGVALLDRREL